MTSRSRIDSAARLASVDGVQLMLRPKEYALLEMLAAAPGRVFSAEQLLERIWGMSWQQAATVVEHVYRLRGKLAALPAPAPRITTVRGYSYRLASLRLIAVSGFSQAGDRAQSRAAGFDAHLAKPLPLTDLLDLLERMERPDGA